MSGRPPEDLLRNLEQAIVPARRANPILLLWRWRYELSATMCFGVWLWWSVTRLGIGSAIGLTLFALAMLVVPAVRRAAMVRVRGIITPHRFRTACRAARIHTNRGRLPAVLWCRPRRAGERLLLWLPAGLTVEALQREADTFAAACFADAAEVIEHERGRHLARLIIVRGVALKRSAS